MNGKRSLVGIGVAATALAIGLGAGATAAVAKKSCRGEDRWKCAPKRYHLEATDSIVPGPQGSLVENWTADIDLVRLRRNFATVIYGTLGGEVRVSGSFPITCPDTSTATARIEPQTIPVSRGPGYPFLGDFGVEFSLTKSSLFPKNSYGGPLGTQGSGHSSLFATAIDPCPGGQGAFLTELTTPLEGMDGRGKVGKVVEGEGVDSRLFDHHTFTWKLTPGKK